MTFGIVGSDGKKFDDRTEEIARRIIVSIIKPAKKVISGGCHLGGIDIWAIEEAKKLNIPYKEFLPKTLNWNGFKERNMLIAKYSDIIICITLKADSYCPHCNTNNHIKSGGCWTVKYARTLGRETQVVCIH